ncbi:putative conserved transmembrane protein [Nostocoides japonicum T1-X7]|uniref:Putative conserved transmembrane protein n=1 Tax=Nostocoides japonicum T1-X7 TaxID=1194083 RepID=A0A077M5C6_9MICO|nr:GtrA family protein [Tetrasphaera japonica]CCH79270.1 putative conserved transmembrane protein [Tetrasphaera japonica T1-X7]
MPALLTRARDAVNVLYREMIKFGIVGAVAFVVDLGGANLLWHTVMPDKVTTAKIISGVAATLVAWVGNRAWTFRHRRNRPVAHEVSLFFVVNGIALVISTATLAISHYAFGFTGTLADNIATIVGIGLGTLFRFWAYRQVVFAREPIATEQRADSEPLPCDPDGVEPQRTDSEPLPRHPDGEVAS